MKYIVEMSSGGIIYVPRLMTNGSGIRVIIREASVLVLLIEGIYDVRLWDGFIWQHIHTKFHED
jgi:hypothetical protein